MIMQEIREKEFDVLGFKVKFNPSTKTDEEKYGLSAQDVVAFVHSEAALIKKSGGSALDSGQLAILVALKIANEKMLQDHKLKSEINILERVAKDALNYVEEVSSSQSI